MNNNNTVNIITGLERLSLNVGAISERNQAGAVFTYQQPFHSELLPKIGFQSGVCLLPNVTPPLETLPRPSYIFQFSSTQSPKNKNVFSQIQLWKKQIIDSSNQNSFEISPMIEVSEIRAYFSLGEDESLPSDSPYDPFTNRYLIKFNERVIGKFRITDCENRIKLITKFYVTSEYRNQLLKILEQVEKNLLPTTDTLFIWENETLNASQLQQSGFTWDSVANISILEN